MGFATAAAAIIMIACAITAWLLYTRVLAAKFEAQWRKELQGAEIQENPLYIAQTQTKENPLYDNIK